ncbi:NAD(P)-binding protein [Streptacidiphilus sp. PB12-B1b]|uniref:phytoene desaturase family protein n=1 Tax=Streptacidiphilus sp. PB12-B1b TaxID=2705012 RepID=UPI0015F9FD26|nr:FAD-dependent oxidoreductase [Streptacidiphilus sp. PB12-B1b]QMU75894.1 NAD(P)-binding protein [Streptacidiphilus sp. PB12-B1b]
MARIVVIGAGMGGLAAAARLATVGHRVTLCEAGPTHGGMVGQFQREGFRFDTGPTLLTLPAVYRDLMLKTGRTRLEDEVELRPVDPGSVHLLPDGTRFALANASRAGVVQALDDALGAGAGVRWGELLERGRGVWEATRRPLLEEPLPDDPSALHQDPYLPARRRRLLGRPVATLADVAARELRHPGLTALLDEYALRFGLDPRRAPASLTGLPYMEQSFGVWYVTGGMRALADAVLRRCEQRRVELRFGAPVAEVLGGSRVEGVLLAGGEKLDADAVVADCPPGALTTQAGPPAQTPTAEAADGPGRFTVLLALRGGRPEGVPHRTVVHAAERADELDALFPAGPGEPRLCSRPTVQLLRPDDPTLAPAGHEAALLTVTVPGQQRYDWTAPGRADAYADAVLAHAAPGLRERVLWREVRTPADTERETGAPGGWVPGPALAGAGGAYLHCANRTALPGLYLVGGAAHPGGGLARVGMSAAVTAELVGTP